MGESGRAKCEERKSHAEARPEVVRLVKALARKKPKGGKMSLRAISTALAEQGHVNDTLSRALIAASRSSGPRHPMHAKQLG